MKKLLIGLAVMLTLSIPANATKLPDNVQDYVKATYPQAIFRFDGIVQLPDGNVYLPLIPSKFNSEAPVDIKYTIPENKTLAQLPDAVVLSNDYVLLKMIKNNKGKNTIIGMAAPPVELITGLFPQDMLVPKNFVVPASMKNIIGNLDVRTEVEQGLVIPVTPPRAAVYKNSLDAVPQLKNKMLYIASNLSKNIQVVDPANSYATYALSRDDVPITIKGYDVFLLVTSYDKKSLDVISLADDKVIKEIEFKTHPDEIIIDNANKMAYVSSGEDASLYVISLETMTIKKQIRLNGMCERIILSDDGTKLFYNDKQTREIWAIELDNDYLLKEIGRFPNVSKIAYVNGKVYLTSRTKSRLAIVDYETLGLMSENAISEKPVDMITYNDTLFVLGAGNSSIDVIDTDTDQIIKQVKLPKNEFPTKFTRIDDTSIALITDAKANVYTIFDLDTQEVIKTNQLDIPVNSVYVTNKIKKIGEK
ncbi:hypothetical protein IKP85_01680 [bacterium]|nr:hypothetical protein [bacterium]